MRMTEPVRALMQDADPARGVREDARRKQVDLERILGSHPMAHGRPDGNRRRLAWRVGISAAVLAAAGTTTALAIVALRPAPPAPVTEIECATRFSFLESHSFVTDLGDAATPEAACRAQWPKEVGQRATGTPPRRVPDHLVACVTEVGSTVITVYPRPEDMTDAQACTTLGLVRRPDGPIYAGATLAQVSQLQHRIDTHLGSAARREPSARCTSYATVHAAAQESLRQMGLDGWRIDDQRSRGDNGVWYYLDAHAGTVVLINPGYCTSPAP
ncbi:hypothetical protein [Streptomyces sp. NBC_00079]|uniref:hypothetical protein n=1 Tax=Streptomyces sp. NBC_00079 TaxID=2975644 RepID=UPI00324384DD